MLNTQPWKLRIHDGALYVYGDHRRQLAALDPQRRALTMSLGCAVFSARAALAADGYGVAVRRFPDPLVSELAAVIELQPGVPVDAALSAPDDDDDGRVAGASRSAAQLPGALLEDLDTAVAAEGVMLHLLTERERRLVSELNRHADEIENLDPTYRAELDAWTSNDGADRDRVAVADECLAVLVTDSDTPLDWLRTGEAMMRGRHVAGGAGYDLRPSTQVVEVASARAQLRRALGLSGHPHMLLRSGRSPRAATNRRRLVDVLIEES